MGMAEALARTRPSPARRAVPEVCHFPKMDSDSSWDSIRFHKCLRRHPMGRDEAPKTRRRPRFRRRAPLRLLLGLRTIEFYRIFLGRSEPYHFDRRLLSRGHLGCWRGGDSLGENL